MFGILGIKTRVNGYIVHTLSYNKWWLTIVSEAARKRVIPSIDSDNLYDAGLTHLRVCEQIKNLREDIRSISLTETDQSTEVTEMPNG